MKVLSATAGFPLLMLNSPRSPPINNLASCARLFMRPCRGSACGLTGRAAAVNRYWHSPPVLRFVHCALIYPAHIHKGPGARFHSLDYALHHLGTYKHSQAPPQPVRSEALGEAPAPIVLLSRLRLTSLTWCMHALLPTEDARMSRML